MLDRVKKFFTSKKAYIFYSVCFAVIFGLITIILYRHDKSFIHYGDAIKQHFMTLNVYRDVLINFFKTGKFNTFTWNIGLGIDLFANFDYYILGDLFSYISIFFKKADMEMVYALVVMMRYYFIGISFILYAKYKKLGNNAAVIGALIYTFSAYSLTSGIIHPYFCNALAIFPIMMIGIEKIINEDKKILFIISVFLSFFITSFYFGYISSLCIAVYGSILIFQKYKNDDKRFKHIVSEYLKVLFYALIGLSLCSFILIPTILQFLGSNRSGGITIYPYTISYFKSLLTHPLTLSRSVGVNALALLVIPLIISRYKKYKNYIWFMLILMIPLLISQVGSIFSGFAYPTNRFVFVIPFILSYLASDIFDDKFKFSKKDMKNIVLVLFIYLSLIVLFDINLPAVATFNFACLLGFIIIISFKDDLNKLSKRFNVYRLVFNSFLVLSLCFSVYYLYTTKGYDYNSQFMNSGEVLNYYETNNGKIPHFSDAITKIKEDDKDFFRISKDVTDGNYGVLYANNASMMLGYHSINYFYSIVPDKLSKLSFDLGNAEFLTNVELGEFNNRTKINTLLGNKYFITPYDSVPYGYEKYSNVDETVTYKNNYSVGFGTFYDYYIDNATYDKLTPLEKETSLLKTVSLDSKDIDNDYVKKMDIKKEISKEIENIDYRVEDEKMRSGGGTFTVSNINKNAVTINVNGKNKNGELYVNIKNLKYEPFDYDELTDINPNYVTSVRHSWFYTKNYGYAVTSNFRDVARTKKYNDKLGSAYSYNTDDYLISLGYFENIDDEEIKIEFSKLGNYTYDGLEILLVNFDGYESDITKLNQANFEVSEVRDNGMKAKVNLKNSGVLQLSTAYSKGWEILVDGKRTDAFISNNYFLGIYLDRGEHEIELIYKTRYLKLGMLCSLIGIAIFGGVVYLEKRKI